LLCDINVAGVYTRNRNFRLLMSTKLGKSSGELKVAHANQFVPKCSVHGCSPAKHARLQQTVENNSDRHSLEQMFLDSLICNVECVSSCYCGYVIVVAVPTRGFEKQIPCSFGRHVMLSVH